MHAPVEIHQEPPLAELLRRIDGQWLPHLRLRSVDPHDPIRVLRLPQPWRKPGCGTDAAVLEHPDQPGLVVKVSAPGRPGLKQEAEVDRRIDCHPAFSRCSHHGAGCLVLRRLPGVSLWDCLRRGIPIRSRRSRTSRPAWPMPSATDCMAMTCTAAI